MPEEKRALFLHAPFLNGVTLNRLEDEVFNDQADDDNGQQTGKHSRNIEQITVFENEPAKTSLAGGNTEDELCSNERAPGEGPADLEARQDRWEGGRHEDAQHIGNAG